MRRTKIVRYEQITAINQACGDFECTVTHALLCILILIDYASVPWH